MTDRHPIMAGNWKMHKDHLEATQLVQKLAYHLQPEDYEGQDVVVCPPFVSLRNIQVLIDAERLDLQLGAQDCHPESSGAFTGEISAPMLARLDVDWVIVGHSERRQLFGEGDELVAAKAAAVQAAGMGPIVAVGETLEERRAGEAADVVSRQLHGSLDGVSFADPTRVVVAYEPIWAIGTGETATPDDAQDMCAHVRSVVAELKGDDVAAAVRVQYGGSVKPGNVRELMSQPDIDGALVGGASLNADDFALIVTHRR
ncbi:triose-phosphate isomerase [Salsipaludibacter albus]|uniref:triose-phosphate isomerase n=1 Tax=Salsipaludibacter albus TaxID=2849650 RepID=UPI001EE411BC|nr:triose-phosphate isomerase [Salsipaludibacter albus]MBY5161687.1 triose-phosphate isomerase [Salsipaludibacter albus]